jgi:uncharacterized protein YndB with AHSA1/START domain
VNQVEPVRKQIMVETSRERAFKVFTDGMDRWWPRSHHIGASPLKRLVLEPHAGGRWYSECEDGSECEVGKVLAWEPPGRVVLAWQITAAWKFDAELITEVEVTFTPEGPKKTRVDLEHRNLERLGTEGGHHREQLDAPGGWSGLLELFAKDAVAKESAEAT